MTGGNSGTPEHISFAKLDILQGGAASVAMIQGRVTSLWGYAGFPSGVDVSTPPSATPSIPTNATTGSLQQANPGGGRQKWLLGVEAFSTQNGVLVLYDRLLQQGALDATVLTAQTVGGVLTRQTGGAGNQIWVEIYSQIGASSTTITASYTNQGATAGKTTVPVSIGNTGLREVGRMIQLPLASGDTGVQAVASVTLAGTTGTAGSFGVTIVHPICTVPIAQAGGGTVRDTITGLPTLPEITTNACLAWYWFAGVTTVPQIYGMTHCVEA